MFFGRSKINNSVSAEPAPHCDTRVLHAPKTCKYCDMHPDWQEYREVALINFTGEHDTTKAPCPSDYFRTLQDINNWAGNIPAPDRRKDGNRKM